MYLVEIIRALSEDVILVCDGAVVAMECLLLADFLLVAVEGVKIDGYNL